MASRFQTPRHPQPLVTGLKIYLQIGIQLRLDRVHGLACLGLGVMADLVVPTSA